MSKFSTLVIIFVLLFIACNAQDQWRYLPNVGYNSDTVYRVEDIYFTDTSTGYAVTLSNRIFKTEDGGVHWEIKNDTSQLSSFRSIEFLNDGITGLAGGVGQVGKVWLTTDTGETWTDISTKIQDSSKYDPKRICGIGHWGNAFYAVGAWSSQTAKFYKSLDMGNTWKTLYLDTNQATSLIDVHFISQDTGFVSGKRHPKKFPYVQSSVILKTTDGGDSWTTVFEDTVFGGYIWKLQFVTNQYAVGAVQNARHPDTVLMVRSLDGGSSWSIVPVGNKSSIKKPGGGNPGTQSCGFANPRKGWVGGYYEGIFETLDSGKTWQYQKFGYDFNRIFVIDSSHIFAGGNKPYKYGTGINLAIEKPQNTIVRPHQLYPVVPNPISGVVPIKFHLGNETNIVIDVVHADTKSVYNVVNTHLQKGDYLFKWDGTNAPAGNYLIWLGNNESPLTQKFVLLK